MDDVRKTAENVTYGVAFRLKSGLCGPETAKTLAARANRQAFQADSAVGERPRRQCRKGFARHGKKQGAVHRHDDSSG
jgi:hypothetical protein